MVIRIVDSVPGRRTGGYDWESLSPKLTLRQIIAERVRREVAAYNRTLPDVYNGLVQPEEVELTLNGERRRRELDPLQEIHRALHAFETQGFVVFADGVQIESLDQEIDLTASSELEFIKLVPLAGG